MACRRGLLEIELTESARVADVAAAGRQIERLCDDGVALALDDFGAGFSGIKTLSWSPASVIKIDKSLIDGIKTQSVKRLLVSGVVALAHELGATSVGEGVEDHHQLAVLHDIGCDHAQGFLVCPPVPAERVRWDYSDMQACQNAGIRARQNARSLYGRWDATMTVRAHVNSAISNRSAGHAHAH